ncbi:MAG TPA: hypothetical protein VEW69_08410, partial [Alphaproteobacteria bacterium]|nr:hypothetical protein [Alphaproteobacteria bacterium]
LHGGLMVKKTFFTSACLMFALGTAVSQDCKKAEYGADQQKYMESALQEFSACKLPLDNNCRSALAKAAEKIYGIKDFSADSKYLTPDAIGSKVAADTNWEHVGSASDQAALKSAQSAANCGRAVVAVLTGENGGHVALILPGTLAHSGAWKLDVPNSASFFTHNPAKSFAGKGLSYSFPKAEGIEIYARKN